ncbi:hypothetical protein ADINL_0378 [Nitrincola lacisaponensis]|uniref:Uncharacterized protein n=1 Tax=Nitrincola lacisaponensis TaxID=267850 RepID=A0A063Y434_9GAMM|nr:hypothetical protein ADINL_0378 [Nitrincola lacisaponensis]
MDIPVLHVYCIGSVTLNRYNVSLKYTSKPEQNRSAHA